MVTHELPILPSVDSRVSPSSWRTGSSSARNQKKVKHIRYFIVGKDIILYIQSFRK